MSNSSPAATVLSTRWKLFLIALLLVAAGEFVFRGPVRFLHALDFNDFISPYIQAKALAIGTDPYSPENLVRLWPEGAHRFDFLARDLASGTLVINRGIPTAYPLTCFLLLTPFAICPWPIAHVAWLVTNLLLVFCLIWSLVSLAGFGWEKKRTYVFVALALALAPFHTGLAAGSIVIVTGALSGIAISAAHRKNDILAGLLLGLAICLKPQIGLPFLVYYLLRRRWRISAVSAGVFVVAAVSAIVRLAASHTPWLQNYQMDNRVLLATGILSDFTERNPIRFSLVNLQVGLYAVTKHATSANILALTISGTMFLLWLLLIWRRNDPEDALLDLSTIAVLSLLPVYHRFYDASLLILPLCWSLSELSGRLKLWARATLLLILPFLVPGGSALEQLELNGHVPETVTHSWWWGTLVMPHQVWALFFLSGLLLWTMKARPEAPITGS